MKDKRIKITPKDRAAIIKAVNNGELISAQARLYGVSRQWVYMILNPDKAIEHAERRKKYNYYDREKQGKANRAYLKRKRESLLIPTE